MGGKNHTLHKKSHHEYSRDHAESRHLTLVYCIGELSL